MTAPRTGRAHVSDAGRMVIHLLDETERLEWLVDYLIQHEPGLALQFGHDQRSIRAGIDLRRRADEGTIMGKAGVA